MLDLFELVRQGLAGRYDLEREIGQGGMARVFLAYDCRHDRPVAVKVFRPEVASAVGQERFLREIHTAAGLHHPHILPVYDSGRTSAPARAPTSCSTTSCPMCRASRCATG